MVGKFLVFALCFGFWEVENSLSCQLGALWRHFERKQNATWWNSSNKSTELSYLNIRFVHILSLRNHIAQKLQALKNYSTRAHNALFLASAKKIYSSAFAHVFASLSLLPYSCVINATTTSTKYSYMQRGSILLKNFTRCTINVCHGYTFR